MSGKDKCRILKDIRKKIAEENDIEYVVEECPHKGECLGTCPKCEADVAYLEKELAKKKKAGIAVAVAGLITIPIAAAVIYENAKTPNSEELTGVVGPEVITEESTTEQSIPELPLMGDVEIISEPDCDDEQDCNKPDDTTDTSKQIDDSDIMGLLPVKDN